MRHLKSFLLPLLLALALPSIAESYLPSGKLGPTEKIIIRGTDAQGRTVYSDHVVDGTKVNKTFQQQTFTSTKSALLPPSPVEKVVLTQGQIDAQNKKIEEANIAIAKKNCATARNEIALIDSGKRLGGVNEKGEVVTMDEAAKQQQKQDFNAVILQNCVS